MNEKGTRVPFRKGRLVPFVYHSSGKISANLWHTFSIRVSARYTCYHVHLLVCVQIPIFSAALIRSSLKSGCAMLISISALSHVVRPFRFAAPYSVMTKLVADLGVVTIVPSGRVGLISEVRLPSLFALVECRQMKLCPPSDRNAPCTKSNWPPVPEICLGPADSDAI